ncbi:uncharacterized protein BO88DRAFT_23340 [Aspergillus vadensis CBS 113365]|uniref:Uncharacterized protein n=1 Tax=Aspergillus vadensis (strain CBS 113365 / IMI 142717 / IBT 24658) TaxID=1448311 RepID=A0A319BU46_ASPVC|nr:hypothetical protein BO88DRAFT_23340 [Aspergillus vadensis CBS 113365]PYH74810.1 hypothetical protein BO88DRAFT_23340 [Aspergillus vadensis CBS 113365]
MMSVFLFPVELAAFRWAGVCIYPSSGCFHLLCLLISILPPSRLLLNLLFLLLSSDIYILRICDKPIWQLNLHPLHFQSSPCLGQCATTYILIIIIYSSSKSAGTHLFNFLHYYQHLAVLLLFLGILCVCVCVCVLSTILSVFGVILIGYTPTILLYVSVSE